MVDVYNLVDRWQKICNDEFQASREAIEEWDEIATKPSMRAIRHNGHGLPMGGNYAPILYRLQKEKQMNDQNGIICLGLNYALTCIIEKIDQIRAAVLIQSRVRAYFASNVVEFLRWKRSNRYANLCLGYKANTPYDSVDHQSFHQHIGKKIMVNEIIDPLSRNHNIFLWQQANIAFNWYLDSWIVRERKKEGRFPISLSVSR